MRYFGIFITWSKTNFLKLFKKHSSQSQFGLEKPASLLKQYTPNELIKTLHLLNLISSFDCNLNIYQYDMQMISHIFSEKFLEALSENVVIIIIQLLETIIHPSTKQINVPYAFA